MKKGDIVFYVNRTAKLLAIVRTLHRDGSPTVEAQFAIGNDGQDLPGYLGYKYRLSGG